MWENRWIILSQRDFSICWVTLSTQEFHSKMKTCQLFKNLMYVVLLFRALIIKIDGERDWFYCIKSTKITYNCHIYNIAFKYCHPLALIGGRCKKALFQINKYFISLKRNCIRYVKRFFFLYKNNKKPIKKMESNVKITSNQTLRTKIVLVKTMNLVVYRGMTSGV